MTSAEADRVSVDALVARIRERLREAADPARTPGQQAYMKSEMPFLGVAVPTTRQIARAAGREAAPDVLEGAARVLWDEASHREERYAAQALLGLDALRGDPQTVPLIEHMVRTGQWWDFTDEVAHRVADLLDAFPAEMALIVRTWSSDEDMWMRRLAIIAQLGRRKRLDADLLREVIDENAADPEFFIRKAVGWALRDAARSAPDWVRSFVASRQLSPLSTREALKHL